MAVPTNNLWQIDAALERLVIPKEYVVIGGDLVVGSLLSQIVYWHRPSKGRSKLRVARDGSQWVAKRREDWMSECCISENEYRRAIAVLRGKGLIEVVIKGFAGKPHTHIRLIEAALLEALSGLKSHRTGGQTEMQGGSGEEQEGLQSIAEEEPQHPVESTDYNLLNPPEASGGIHHFPPEVLVESTGSNTETTLQRLHTEITNSDEVLCENSVAEKNADFSQKRSGKKNVKASEVLQNMKNLKVKKAETSTNFGQRWRSNVSLLYPDTFIGPLTGKDLGMLKHYAKAAGEHALPAMDHALNHWTLFAQEAALATGDKPAFKPTIAFLLKHSATAVTLFLQSIAVAPEAPANPSLPTTPLPDAMAGVIPEEVHHETDSDILDTLSVLQSMKETKS